MQASNAPTKIQRPFADSGDKQTIPVPSQIGITDGRASFTDGFPPLTRTPVVAGGVPPFGTDMNGILNAITAIQQWQNAGGFPQYDSAFSAAVGGYPKYAILQKADGSGLWISTADNNTNNPDTGGANWVDLIQGAAYGLDSGAANAYAVTFAPALTALRDGMVLRFKAANANTGASTFNPNGLGTKPIVGGAHAALQGGEIVASSDVWLQYNSSIGGGSWILVDSTGGAMQTANATQSQHAVTLGQLPALDLIKTVKRQVITASATYTPSAGMVFADVEIVGGGAGGGGAAGGSSTSAAGAGGGAGGYTKKVFTAAQIGASQVVTIGAAGTAGAAGNNVGGGGGNTTFGALLTANGGAAGAGCAAITTAGIPAAGGPGGTATGGNVNVRGAAGFASFVLGGASGGLSGQGGSSIYGGGGYPSGPIGSGNPGTGYGSGGSGGACLAVNAAGAPGTAGICIITEYCTQ